MESAEGVWTFEKNSELDSEANLWESSFPCKTTDPQFSKTYGASIMCLQDWCYIGPSSKVHGLPPKKIHSYVGHS